MDCTEVEAHLPLFVGGDLETPLAVKVEAHLQACQGCGGRLEAAGRARSALLELAARTRAEARLEQVDLWPGVRALLAEEGLVGSPSAAAARSAARPVPGRVLSFARYLGGAAAAAVLALLVWNSFGDDSSRPVGPGVGPAGTATAGFSAPSQVPAGLLHRVAGGSPLEATPLLPAVTPVGGGLRRIGPEDELLRDRARVFPEGPTRFFPLHARGQSGWSLASDGEFR